MGDPSPEGDDPYSAANVAPVVAWLLGDAARTVTGRVFEVGGGQVSVAKGWRPGVPARLSPGAPIADVGHLVAQLLDDAPTAAPVQRPDPALLRT